MMRLIYCFCIVFLIACSFIIIACYPDDISVIWGNRIYKTNPFVMLSIFYFLIFAFILISNISRFFLSFPSIILNTFQKHNSEKGYKSLYKGLISIAAQNVPLARKMFSYISKHHVFNKEPLAHMLEVQVALADKQYNVVHEKLGMMLNIPLTKEFAIYHLYLESFRRSDFKSAKHYAEQALKMYSDVPWAIEAIVQYYAIEKNWSKAINCLDEHKKIKNNKTYDKNKAILLIASSLDNAKKGNIIDSYNDAIESLKLCNNSIMGSICAAKSLISQNKKSKAEVILEKIWKINPHPEIADIYTKILSKNPTEKLDKALKLEKINNKSIESMLIVSKTSLEAGNIDLARTKAMLAMQANPRKEVFLLIAQIEQESSNNLNKIFYWTQKALLNAIPDPLWISDDGYLSSTWLPISPLSKALCYFEWKIPTKSPEYIHYKDTISSIKLNNNMFNIQILSENDPKNYPFSSDKSPYFKDDNKIILDPHIRQLDDPGVKNKTIKHILY
ncbi:heme biosynthesis protein HemY [Candidatus Liberibacter brunswickensis]|uniref:heme biosynthesis protein HemY n=1 Tax=Candidatus Liberibacter brunswickensis TaxID=1968796 RepID=UPI002FDF800A